MACYADIQAHGFFEDVAYLLLSIVMLGNLFAVLLLLHGVIHLPGFIKGFGIARVSQLPKAVSKTGAVFWLVSALLFIACFSLYIRGLHWWLPALIAVAISQILIVTAWAEAKWGTVVNIMVLTIAITDCAGSRYEQAYKADVAALKLAQVPDTLLTDTDIMRLPPAVQRYIRYTKSVGKPRVKSFYITFTGGIRKDNNSEWMPFVSEQHNFMAVPARLFFMKARMKGLPVAGYHSYKAGGTFMDIRLLSLFRVQYEAGSYMDTAETVTFFNDMCCMAPATLIDQRIQWLMANDSCVKASFTNKGITVYASLYFNTDGTLVNFVSTDRYATRADGGMERIPWSTPLSNYRNINGYRIASDAKAIYHYPAGDLCYGTFRLKGLQYNQ